MGSETSKSKKRATHLAEEEVQLLLKNTHFNRQQIMEWHQGFLVSVFVFVFFVENQCLYRFKQSQLFVYLLIYPLYCIKQR